MNVAYGTSKPALVLVLLTFDFLSFGATSSALFQAGTAAYQSGQYPAAAQAFKDSSALQPSSGTLQNLGLAEWERGQPGPAIVAWERSLWLDPFSPAVRGNLRFARKTALLDAPDLAWYEVVSTWLPANWWAWIGAISFWIAIAAILLPGIFRIRKSAWHQAIAALGLTVFLLTLPAVMGVETRSRIGFIIEKNSPLRWTPTTEADFKLPQLSPGEPARVLRSRGDFLLIKIRSTAETGWVLRNQLALMSDSR
jgi:tetratricopeptide (TPR) repeat protein